MRQTPAAHRPALPKRRKEETVQEQPALRDKLLAIYDRLSPVQQFLLQLCSIIFEKATTNTVYNCFQSTGCSFANEPVASLTQLTPHLNKLQQLKLLDKHLRCHEAIVELMTRRAAADWGQKQASSSTEQTGTNLFAVMARAVRKKMPAHYFYYHDTTQLCQRIMGDLRIGIYTHDFDLCLRSRDNLLNTYKSAGLMQSEPLLQVIMNPFDPAWLSSLPESFQARVFAVIFTAALQTLEPVGPLLDYVLNEDFLAALPAPEKNAMRYNLACRLLMTGRLDEARKQIQALPPGVDGSIGMNGWIFFVQGKNDEALEAFAEDARLWRKELKKRAGCFVGLPGLFYMLALLRRSQEEDWREMDQIWLSSRQAYYKQSYYGTIYKYFRAVLTAKNAGQEAARALLGDPGENTGIAVFFRAFTAYWVDGSLNQATIDELSELFVQAREVGLSWLAMETAELLCRTEQRTPIRENYIRLVQTETGMQPFLPFMQIEEGWRKSLRFLQQIANGDESDGKRDPELRLVWLLGVRGSTITLQAKEQKMSTKGGWTKGRMVPLFRLANSEALESASRQDKEILAAFERDAPYYFYHGSQFNLEKALPALVGHPLVFLEENPEVAVEIVRGEPEIIVSRAGAYLNISLQPTAAKQRVALIRETPTRFKVVQFSDAHLRMAALLGKDGLSVPPAGKEEVAAAITSLSSLVTVHSAIAGAAEDIEAVAADPRPYIHLMPTGGGFRAEIFVRPFAGQGPYLKPGVGAANLIADIEGRRMQARRNLKLEKEKAAVVEVECPVLAGFSEAERSWLLQDPEDCLQMLIDMKPLQERGDLVVEWPEGEKLRLLRVASFDQLRMQIRGKTNWFEVSGQLQVDDKLVLDMRELLDLMQPGGSRFVPLGEGQYIALTEELRRRLEELKVYSEKKGKTLGVHPLAALALEDLTAQLTHLEVDLAWQQRLDRIRSAQAVTPLLPSTFKGQLRDYQLDGYRWLARLAHMGVGACLADDMGLGKTIQALAIILERAPLGPSLVVAPTSVCMNWLTEASRFAPTLNVRQLVGSNRENVVKDLAAHDLLVTSYGLLHQEAELLASVQWNVIVLDEAQAIKNITTKRAQAAMNLDGGFKIITTGTPIENHLSELWTLFNFINPGLLGSYKRFSERFVLPIEKYNDRNVQKRLKKLIQPFILRRTKAQVLEELPPRTDVLLRVEMSAQEAAFYEALRRQSLERIEADHAPIFQKQLKILAEIMRLRQAACNPRLVVPESDLPSAKLDLFGEIVAELLENGHKALVFSQFVGHLALIRQFLDGKGIDYRYLDGSTPPSERKKQVDAFQAGHGDLFLISLKAGGLGLNLTAADYVIHMDPWWNPAVEDQASDRTHRIGQQRPVTVYRLVTEATIEEKIVKLHQEKRDLAGSLLDGSDMAGKISADELLQLIKEG